MADEQEKAAEQPKVQFDTSNLKNSYANVTTMNSTQDEVILSFGLNKSWEMRSNEVQIELSNRIILNPYAAKRLWVLMGAILSEYEKRFGELKIDVGNPSGASKTQQ